MSLKFDEKRLPPGPRSVTQMWSELPSNLPWPKRYESALEKLEEARRRIRELEKQNQELTEENGVLRQPQVPSWVRPNLSSQRKRRNKKPGPKVGHKASVRTLPPPEKIDREVKIAPEHCPRCQTADLPRPSTWHTHVQIDVPDVQKLEITRYYVGYAYCRGCHTLVGAPLEQKQKMGMSSYSKYGPRLHALLTYWKYGQGMSFGKIKAELTQEFDLKISRGQISEMLAHSAEKLELMYSQLRQTLRVQHHVHADETGWRKSGDNAWLWSFSNEQFSFYRIERRRNRKVVINTLGKKFSGILISDFYPAYNEIQCPKQKCWVHLLRETKKLEKEYPKNPEVRAFHKKLKSFYRRGVRLQLRFQKGKSIETGLTRLLNETREFTTRVHEHPDLRRLARRMRRNKQYLYTFIQTGVDPTNNSAEREIRPAVLMRKNQFCNRSDRGAHTQEILMSVIRTCFKQNINYLDLAAQSILVC